MRELRAILGDYEVTFEPVMTPPGIKWAPYVSVAVEPYRVTRLPRCRVHGLHEALTKADDGAPVVAEMDDRGAEVIQLEQLRLGRLRQRLRGRTAVR